ncbi:myosin light chain kinase 2, skeletal/cardiac muscle isoform X1 [Carassius carassius]|uniref:myosin light chain kinase 2, skeletal/cardiac muscle isoform X1 n=1 Tax=Carassius carassius TaxID=217509 RepID=UPI0028685248|nr:myosin light chain kinase 2, skeletal/cardiac muscle isoform X1 [Carassius carassius]XP_059358545.1 myosin light chain kinase 2, skeletal/cardiac muscle isoform X1 [Carassius carassius]
MSSANSSTGIDLLQVRIDSLSSKMDRLISIQEKVLSRLNGMSMDIDGIEKEVETLKVEKEEIHFPPVIRTGPANEMKEMCQEMNSIMLAVNQRSEQQTQKLEGMERLVMSIQQVVSFIGETVKTTKIMDIMFKGPASRKSKAASALRSKECKIKLNSKCEASDNNEPVTIKLRDHKVKEGKFRLSLKGLKAQKKKKPPDSADAVSLKKQALLLEEVQKLNQENAERSEASQHLEKGVQKSEDGLVTPIQQDLILEEAKPLEPEQEKSLKEENEVTLDLKEDELKDAEPKREEVQAETPKLVEEESKEMPLETTGILKDQEVEGMEDQTITSGPSETDITDMEPATPTENSVQSTESEQTDEVTTSSKRHVTEEDLGLEDHKKSRVEEGEDKSEEKPQEPEDLCGVFKADGVEFQLDFSKLKKESYENKDEDHSDHFFIDCTPPPAAPFNHRVVSAKPNQINNFYTINRQEVLGGGRYGQVHKCIENSSGLTLAAKIIKARSQKEKEVVKNEIQVMNQLDHANLIQLYAAYESRNDIILVLEYVDGGELFDRIIDENYKLTELDTVMFIRQICEGLRYMHKMYILHLDLKPENILCVSRLTNKVKIIDFGLARKYQPREKLRVNFGTPEFLSPEVVNYDFVSFNTDMWSLGVITYMLLSGLSPFLGDEDSETLNNILACQWNFEEDEFSEVSEEAKDFISKLLVVDKSWRIGATEALKHPWLSDPAVHYRLHQKKNRCRSRRNSCLPPPES